MGIEGFIDFRLLEEPVVSLEEHGLHLRIINIFEEHLGVIYLKDFLKYTPEQVEGVRGIGTETMKSLREAVRSLAEEMFGR